MLTLPDFLWLHSQNRVPEYLLAFIKLKRLSVRVGHLLESVNSVSPGEIVRFARVVTQCVCQLCAS